MIKSQVIFLVIKSQHCSDTTSSSKKINRNTKLLLIRVRELRIPN